MAETVLIAGREYVLGATYRDKLGAGRSLRLESYHPPESVAGMIYDGGAVRATSLPCGSPSVLSGAEWRRTTGERVEESADG